MWYDSSYQSMQDEPEDNFSYFGMVGKPQRSYTVGNGTPAGRAAAIEALKQDAASAQTAYKKNYAEFIRNNPDVATGWDLNHNATWLGSQLGAAASQWYNGHFRPGKEHQPKPFIMLGGGGGFAQQQDDEGPAFRPGLTGGVEGRPQFRPYNNGDFSTQKGGVVGRNFTKDAFNNSNGLGTERGTQISMINMRNPQAFDPSGGGPGGLTPMRGLPDDGEFSFGGLSPSNPEAVFNSGERGMDLANQWAKMKRSIDGNRYLRTHPSEREAAYDFHRQRIYNPNRFGG